MTYTRLAKDEIAISQINVAIDLYMQDSEYISVITLLGAAEEILGKLLQKNGLRSAFDINVEQTLDLHEKLWSTPSKRKHYVYLKKQSTE